MVEAARKTLIIGERINPTGRPGLAGELERGNLESVAAEAVAQAEAGADVIDVNVGTPGVVEAELLPEAVRAVHEATGLPVCADSADPAALLAAVGTVPGMLINSVTGDRDFLDALVPAVADGDAALIGITKDMTGIPATFEERMEMASRIVDCAASHGMGGGRILIDFLTAPVSVEQESAAVTLRCIAEAGPALGVGTVLGASNISYGMPLREVINASFLSMAVSAGLTAAIVNPLEPGTVQAILAADVLVGRDRMGRAFLKDYRKRSGPGA